MREEFKLDDRVVVICHPEKPNGKWALKTEYFDAFPEVQNKLLDMGYYVAHIVNKTRWHHPSDTDARAQLADYMTKRFGVSKKCVIIGMSCGGMQGIYFASKYPELVSCMYLDAPVVNLLSCPAGFGKGMSIFDEFHQHTGMELTELLGYRNHPLDHLPNLVKHNIPVILVSGDADTVVPFDENGKYLKDIYEKNNCIIETIIKKGGDHHPHSLPDNTPIIDFILKYDCGA
ncbi:MAG: alpha/beta fold hydrolase [Clostridia bacterium]|nr:alpha/beta fold hydrolase [Clostridia bacterium]MBQ9997458.1 alpha/beta fold hydrolase [Clostridia bacterium]